MITTIALWALSFPQSMDFYQHLGLYGTLLVISGITLSFLIFKIVRKQGTAETEGSLNSSTSDKSSSSATSSENTTSITSNVSSSSTTSSKTETAPTKTWRESVTESIRENPLSPYNPQLAVLVNPGDDSNLLKQKEYFLKIFILAALADDKSMIKLCASSNEMGRSSYMDTYYHKCGRMPEDFLSTDCFTCLLELAIFERSTVCCEWLIKNKMKDIDCQRKDKKGRNLFCQAIAKQLFLIAKSLFRDSEGSNKIAISLADYYNKNLNIVSMTYEQAKKEIRELLALIDPHNMRYSPGYMDNIDIFEILD